MHPYCNLHLCNLNGSLCSDQCYKILVDEGQRISERPVLLSELNHFPIKIRLNSGRSKSQWKQGLVRMEKGEKASTPILVVLPQSLTQYGV
ncbi:hypothetical protein TNIN_398971 [Trichonephila inaurata madagascariensis]|uniref:Uncharacterized protein n=1 Tax=Trichonephila inaurata madagascariensis TaxID=2747483 RepID=A0A8X6MDZ4_9ARAC|nr:hypothetical protein TNIN_193311 [Trichonephila inaurata madagascariensis]GFY61932.1 hypothetical protein TNIN_398971 [Trichonephila inaurata madagascariensis]